MKDLVEFTDIKNGKVTLFKEDIRMVRQYEAVDPDKNTVEIFTLIVTRIGDVSIPVTDSYEDTLKKLDFA